MKSLDNHFVREFLRRWKDCVETENLDKIASNSTTLTEDGQKVELKWQVNTRYARFLYVLVRMFEPEKILEIGMANGISSAYIAKAQNLYAQKRHTHVIVDPYKSSEWHNAGKALLQRLDLYHNVKVIEDYSLSAIPHLEKDAFRLDSMIIQMKVEKLGTRRKGGGFIQASHWNYENLDITETMATIIFDSNRVVLDTLLFAKEQNYISSTGYLESRTDTFDLVFSPQSPQRSQRIIFYLPSLCTLRSPW